MSSAFDQIGEAGAAATLAAAQAMGVRISLQHRSGEAATLWAEIIGQVLGAMQLPGVESEAGVLMVLIPVQTGFAVMTSTTRPVTIGDRIEYPLSSGRYFWVEYESDIEQLDNGYVYRVQAREHKSITVGVMS